MLGSKRPCTNVIRFPERNLVQQCGLAIGNGERPVKMIKILCKECQSNGK